MRFLIVDDSSTMRRIIINTLTKLGYKEFHEAGNGREGLEKLASTPVDMIITDWNMPEMSGIDFIRAVRANSANPRSSGPGKPRSASAAPATPAPLIGSSRPVCAR